MQKASTSSEHSPGSSVSQQPEENASTSTGSSPDSSCSQLDKEGKVERARMLVEQRRREKEEQEKQENLKKETARRQEGQAIAKARREREERKAKEVLNQIKEDRAKEKAAREAVKQQIARDRAEREARREAEKQERSRAQTTGPSSTSPGRISSNVRLQFRLPDGNSVSQVFPSDALLEAARQFITSHTGPASSKVRMFTTYPKRELTDEDLVKTLTDLGLAPSATIIVSPSSGSGALSTSSGSSDNDWFMWILTPIFVVISLIKSFMFGTPQQHKGAYGGNDSQGVGTTNAPSSAQSQNSASGPVSGARRRQTGNKPVGNRDGNVFRLRQDNDDDDNNTWNGNSTQQM